MSDARQRLMELLAERATSGLEPAQRAELDSLVADRPDWDDDTLDLAAAAIDVEMYAENTAPPVGLKARLTVDAADYFGVGSQRRSSSAEVVEISTRRKLPAMTMLGWVAAAAASLAAVIAWWPRILVPDASPTTLAATIPDLDPAAARQELLASADDVVRIDWTGTEDPTAGTATGDVVWSDREQTGYMRFAGLQPNDPAAFQYQLWIFDAQRDERFPVDGGVFDVPADGSEVVVPIEAKLPVSGATLFAVTVEPPGGVVVSTRERIALVASVGD